jgi:hypothetical protein
MMRKIAAGALLVACCRLVVDELNLLHQPSAAGLYTEHSQQQQTHAQQALGGAEQLVVVVAPPPSATVPTWSVEDVASWMRASSVPGAEMIAAKLVDEEVDGKTLLSLESKTEVKVTLGLPLGKAVIVWQAIQGLKTKSPQVGGPHTFSSNVPYIYGARVYTDAHAKICTACSCSQRDGTRMRRSCSSFRVMISMVLIKLRMRIG